jgi:C4-dicarboxylate-specific signal transduction histidine kinase
MNSHILTDTECLESDWWLRRIHPDDADVYVRAGRTLMHRDVWRGRYRAYSKRRGWRTFQVDVQVTERISAAEIGFISFAIDITERTLIEEREQGTARLVTMGRIAAGIAHEVNQPLNVIRLAAENAIIASTDPAAGDYVRTRLARIKEQVARAEKITGQLRVLGRAPVDSSELFEVGDALLTAVDLVEQDLLAVGIPIIYQGAPPAAMLRGPRQHLEQSVINLVLNARDSVLERRQRGIVVPTGDWVELLAVNDGEGNVRISVRDTGTGIPPDALPHIFEAFFTTKEVDKGSGLGLSIVHSTVTGMGGQIIARNDQAGACFELVFKSEPPDSARSPMAAPEGCPRTAANSSPAQRASRRGISRDERGG